MPSSIALRCFFFCLISVPILFSRMYVHTNVTYPHISAISSINMHICVFEWRCCERTKCHALNLLGATTEKKIFFVCLFVLNKIGKSTIAQSHDLHHSCGHEFLDVLLINCNMM